MRARPVVLALALLALASTATAQVSPTRYLEIRPNGGAIIPAGSQADVFKSAAILGVQAAWEVQEQFHFVGSFSWSPGTGKFVAPLLGVDVFQYDAGVELGKVVPLSGRWELKPFAGIGAGARTFSYEDASMDGTTAFSAYGALGTEVQYRPVAFRLEARGYSYSFQLRPIDASKNAYDFGLSFGIAYHMR